MQLTKIIGKALKQAPETEINWICSMDMLSQNHENIAYDKKYFNPGPDNEIDEIINDHCRILYMRFPKLILPINSTRYTQEYSNCWLSMPFYKERLKFNLSFINV